MAEKKILSGLDIDGNVIVSGTVDGRDVASDGSTLDTVETTVNTISPQVPLNTASRHDHTNEASLDSVSGTNTGDQDLTGFGKIYIQATEPLEWVPGDTWIETL